MLTQMRVERPHSRSMRLSAFDTFSIRHSGGGTLTERTKLRGYERGRRRDHQLAKVARTGNRAPSGQSSPSLSTGRGGGVTNGNPKRAPRHWKSNADLRLRRPTSNTIRRVDRASRCRRARSTSTDSHHIPIQDPPSDAGDELDQHTSINDYGVGATSPTSPAHRVQEHESTFVSHNGPFAVSVFGYNYSVDLVSEWFV